MQTFLKSHTIESIHRVPSALDKPMFYTLKWFKWYHCLQRKLWETTPSFELPSNSCRAGCVPFPDTSPPLAHREGGGQRVGFPGDTRQHLRSSERDTVPHVENRKEMAVIALTPLFFGSLPKGELLPAPLGGGTVVECGRGRGLGSGAARLSSCLLCHGNLRSVAGRHRIPQARQGSIHPSLLALGLGVLRPGRASLPRWSQVGPPGARPPREASQKSPAWLQRRRIGRSPQRAARWVQTRCPGGKGRKLLWCERALWLAGFFIHYFSPRGLGIRYLIPPLQAKQWVEEMGAGAPDCGNDCNLSFHSLCLGLPVCKVWTVTVWRMCVVWVNELSFTGGSPSQYCYRNPNSTFQNII